MMALTSAAGKRAAGAPGSTRRQTLRMQLCALMLFFGFQSIFSISLAAEKLTREQIEQLAPRYASKVCRASVKCHFSIMKSPLPDDAPDDPAWIVNVIPYIEMGEYILYPPGLSGSQLHFDVYGKLLNNINNAELGREIK